MVGGDVVACDGDNYQNAMNAADKIDGIKSNAISK